MAKKSKKAKKTSSKNKNSGFKNALTIAAFATIIVMIGGICFGFAKMEDYVRYDICAEHQSSVPLRLVDKPDWVNQALLKRINTTAKMSLERLPFEPATAKMVARNLHSHLKWLTNITVKTTHNAIEVRADYRRPIAKLQTDDGIYYVDENMVALDYIPINNISIVEITGFKNRQKPIPGELWREDDIAAGVKLIRMLQAMDTHQPKKLIYHIESVDVSNYNKRGASVSQLVIKTVNGPDILWGAEPGQAEANMERSEEEKLMSLYQLFRTKGTLQGKYRYIDLRDPND